MLSFTSNPVLTYPSYITAFLMCVVADAYSKGSDKDDNNPPPGPKSSPHPHQPPSPRRLMGTPASTSLGPGSSSSPHWAMHPLAHPARPLHPHLLPPRSVNATNSPWVNARYLTNPSLNPMTLAHGLMRPDLMMMQQHHRHRVPNPASHHMGALGNTTQTHHRKLMAGTADKNHALPAVQVTDWHTNPTKTI